MACTSKQRRLPHGSGRFYNPPRFQTAAAALVSVPRSASAWLMRLVLLLATQIRSEEPRIRQHGRPATQAKSLNHESNESPRIKTKKGPPLVRSPRNTGARGQEMPSVLICARQCNPWFKHLLYVAGFSDCANRVRSLGLVTLSRLKDILGASDSYLR